MNTKKKFVATALAVTANIGILAGSPATASDNSAVSITSSSVAVSVDENLRKAVWEKCDKGDLKAALDLVNQAIAANPKNATAYLCKSMVLYYGHKGNAQVLEALSQALLIEPKLTEALIARAYLNENMNDYQAALKDFDAILALDPRNEKALQQRIKMHYALGDAQGLVADFTLKISNNPNDATAYYERGLAYEQAGDKDKAIADLRTAQGMFVARGEDRGAQAAKDKIASIQKTA